MTIRRATEADEPVLRELWEEFEREVPAPPGFGETWEEAWSDLSRHVRAGFAAIAEDDEGAEPAAPEPQEDPPTTSRSRQEERVADHDSGTRDTTPAVGTRGEPASWRRGSRRPSRSARPAS